MDISALIDIAKVASIVISAVLLYQFRKDILRIVTDIVIGGDSTTYQDMSIDNMMESINEKMDRVLK